MAEDDSQREPTQQTQPKGIDPKTGRPYEPVEIPSPEAQHVGPPSKNAPRTARMFQPKPPTTTVREFVDRYMENDPRIIGVRIGDLDGRETLEVQVMKLDAGLPETFNGIPVGTLEVSAAAHHPARYRDIARGTKAD